jgi:hypothetical protein
MKDKSVALQDDELCFHPSAFLLPTSDLLSHPLVTIGEVGGGFVWV